MEDVPTMVKNISKDRHGVMDVLMTVHVTMPVEDYTVVTISKLKTLQTLKNEQTRNTGNIGYR